MACQMLLDPEELRARLESLTIVSAERLSPADAVDGRDELIWRPFPTDTFPEPLAAYIRESAAAIGCDESFVALPLLSSLAGAIGNTRRVKLKRNWSEPAVVWSATVGESGSAKSPALEQATRPVSEQQKEIRRQQARAVAKWREAVAAWDAAGGEGPKPEEPPPCPALWIDDATVEAAGAILAENDRGTFLVADELAGWMGSFDQYRSGKGSDRSKWLRFHGGREVRIDRKGGNPKTLYLPYASVSVAGTVQPGILQKHLTRENRDSGFAARLLFAWPPRRPRRWTEAEVEEATMAAVADVFVEALYPGLVGRLPR